MTPGSNLGFLSWGEFGRFFIFGGEVRFFIPWGGGGGGGGGGGELY